MSEQQFFMGRQPIVGRDGELVAYELLFRGSAANHAVLEDDVAASAAVIQHAFFDLGIEAALGDKRGFINVSEAMLMHDLIETLPQHRVVLELLETIAPTPAVVERCRALKAAGFCLALDDVTSLSPGHTALLPLIDIVKIDMLAVSAGEAASLAAALRPSGVTLLAEKIDDKDRFAQCLSQGYALFQGYHFAKPAMLTGRALPPSVLVLLKLFTLVAADAEIEELEAVLKRAPDISVRLLKLVNSAAFSLTRKISSLRVAIAVLGRLQLNRLLQIMMFAQQSSHAAGADPLIQTAVVRGRLMEALAAARGHPELMPRAFMTGMLSLVDALFGQPLEGIIALLNLDESVQAALLRREGELGALLDLVELSERGAPEAVETLIRRLGLPGFAYFNQMQVEALTWAASL